MLTPLARAPVITGTVLAPLAKAPVATGCPVTPVAGHPVVTGASATPLVRAPVTTGGLAKGGPGQPICGTPTLGPVSSASPTTATVPLALGVNNTFPVAVLVTGPGGFSQSTTAGVAPIQLTGLAQATAYTVRVTAPCAASNQTAAPVSATFTTPTLYCSGNLGGFCGPATITDVQTVGTTLANVSQSPNCNAAAPPARGWGWEPRRWGAPRSTT